ncbi:hypothetical protein V6N12_024449 [Hibiscus sabdariffa]|uniref:Uncharacterized protein n=1 Tax=Hibiscus sabdariffa TaxID=183260 RepID=A0ABR2G0L5_9ROSI
MKAALHNLQPAPCLLKILFICAQPCCSSWRMSDKKGFISALPAFQVSLERVKSLGIIFTPLEVSLKDTIDGLREKKLLSV